MSNVLKSRPILAFVARAKPLQNAYSGNRFSLETNAIVDLGTIFYGITPPQTPTKSRHRVNQILLVALDDK